MELPQALETTAPSKSREKEAAKARGAGCEGTPRSLPDSDAACSACYFCAAAIDVTSFLIFAAGSTLPKAPTPTTLA